MNKLRFWITATLVWFFVLLNTERFHEPINISSFVYVLAMALSLGLVVIPPLHSRAVGGLIAGALGIFVILKIVLGYQVAGHMLPITITEAVAICTSVFVAHRLAQSLRQFEQSVLELNGLSLAKYGLEFLDRQEEIYREVRRARKFQRPLSVVTIDAPLNLGNPSLDRLIAEAQKSMQIEHLRSRLIEMIAKDLDDSDILSIKDGKFVLFLTETDRKDAEEVSRRITTQIETFLDYAVKTGIASFPDEEITLTGLLSRSESELESFNHFRFGSEDDPEGKEPDQNEHALSGDDQSPPISSN